MNRSQEPPQCMLALFRCFCHREYAEDIEGDLRERYHSHLAAVGRGKANFLLAKEILFLFRPQLLKCIDKTENRSSMSSKSWLYLVAANLIVILMIISPFIPGPANKIVGMASILGQMIGLAGLILLPTGIAWLVIETRLLRANQQNRVLAIHLAKSSTAATMFIFLLGVLLVPNPMPKMTFLIGFLLQVAAFLIARARISKWQRLHEQVGRNGAPIILAASIIATLTLMYTLYLLMLVFSTNGITIAIAVALLPLGLTWMIKEAGKLKKVTARFNTVPGYLVTMPVIAFLTFQFAVEPLSTFSRNYAIKQSQCLIDSIETYKAKSGQYPSSLDDIAAYNSGRIPKPFIMGVNNNFRYNKINDQYSLSFSQWLIVGSLEEIVLYDKGNLKYDHSALGPYNYSLDLWRVKGAYASGDTDFENWKYYHCD